MLCLKQVAPARRKKRAMRAEAGVGMVGGSGRWKGHAEGSSTPAGVAVGAIVGRFSREAKEEEREAGGGKGGLLLRLRAKGRQLAVMRCLAARPSMSTRLFTMFSALRLSSAHDPRRR